MTTEPPRQGLLYGNVALVGPPAAFSAKSRYVALLDVLAMKAWVERDGPTQVAAALYPAIVECSRQATSGVFLNADRPSTPFGPLVGTYLFSDCLFAYSPDDSWASLKVMCDFVRMLLGVALNRGIPLRGAISVGAVAIDKPRGILVGRPLADAYLSDRAHPHRGVGVHITSAALASMLEKARVEHVPLHLTSSFFENLFHGIDSRSESLVWHCQSLFVDHWLPEYTVMPHDQERLRKKIAKLEERFHARALPAGDPEKLKLRQTVEFLLSRRRAGNTTFPELPPETITRGMHDDLLALATIGLADGTAGPG